MNSHNSSILRDERVIASYLPNNSEGAHTPWRAIVNLSRLLCGEPLRLFVSLGILACSAAATLLQPRVVGYLVDQGLIPRNIQQVAYFISVYALLEVIRVIGITLQGIVIGKLGQDVMHRLRVDLVSHVLRLKCTTLDTIPTGQILSRVTGDVNALGQLFSVGIVSIVEKMIVVIGVLVTLVLLSPELAMSSLVLFPLMIGLGILLSIFSYRYTRAVRRTAAGITAFLTDSLRNTLVSRLFKLADIQVRRYWGLNTRLEQDSLKPLYMNAFFHPAITLINAGSIALVMYFGSQMVQSGELSIGVLSAFIAYVLWLFWPVIHIVNQWSVLSAGLASVERVYEIFDWEVEPHQPKTEDKIFDPEPFPERVGEIEFKQVWFQYPNSAEGSDGGSQQQRSKWALQDISFVIYPRQRVGLVGLTGCGKSTIVALLFKLYEPQQGEIFLNGVSLKEWPNHVLRRYIGILQQDGTLFGGTIRENLSMSGGLEQLEDLAAYSARLRDLSRKVEHLSSGERQWVMFARAFLRTPKLWVLDEAAAHLDPEMDDALHDAVQKSSNGQTYLIVAHRISTVEKLDVVIVLHHGKLVECGTPGVLRRTGGLYARLLGQTEKQ